MSPQDEALAQRIIGFLRQIGIDVQEGELPPGSFLPGVRITRGGLLVDLQQLLWPGDLLHEAGHLAVVPAAVRAALDDALQEAPDVQYGGEIEATAWAWAASRYLGLDAAVLFHDGGYRGHAAGLRLSFEMGVFLGVSGLVHTGMTTFSRDATQTGLPAYPQMRIWLRE